MAPTFRPYQSVGRGLNQLNLPEGAEAQEASRTMTVLSRSMDQMSSFFFKRAEEQARIEGEKFGIENISLEKLKQANKENRDIFDVPAFGNTVFGKSARASALTVLENETIVEATKSINDIVFQAETNFTNPTIVRNQIDATILGYVNALTPSAPVLAKKVSASLELSGARVYDSYRSAHAKSTTSSLQTSSLISLITQLDVEKGKIHGLFSRGEVNQISVDGLRALWLKKLDDTTYGLKTAGKKEFAKSFEDMLTSFITEKAFDLVNNAGGNASTEIMGIRDATTSDENLNKLLKLRVSDSDLKKKIADDLLQVLRNKRAEQDRIEQDEEAKRVVNVENTKVAFSKSLYSGPNDTINYPKAEEAIKAMRGLDSDEADKLMKTLNSAQGGVRIDDDLGDETVRDVLADTDIITYDILNTLMEEKKLSVATFKELDKIADAKTDTQFKSALATVSKNLQYNETDIKIKALDKTTRLKEQAFLNVKDKLIKARNKAIATNTPVDLVELAETLTENVSDNLKTNLKQQNEKLFKNTMRGFSIKLADPQNLEKFGLQAEDVPELDDLVAFGNFFIRLLSDNRDNRSNINNTVFAISRDRLDTTIQNIKDQLEAISQ